MFCRLKYSSLNSYHLEPTAHILHNSKFDKQTPNLCLNQFCLHSTQASHTHRKIFIKPPKLVAQPRSIALFDHNRRGYQCDTRPDQCASKYAPERTTGGTYMLHGHFFIFILSSFFYLSSETSYDFLVKPVSFHTSPQKNLLGHQPHMIYPPPVDTFT